MKKYVIAFVFSTLIFGSVVTVSAASGTSYPDNGRLKHTWNTAWSATGDYTYSCLSGYGKQKRAYARMGSDATWSPWSTSKANDAWVKDWGPWGGSYSADYSYK